MSVDGLDRLEARFNRIPKAVVDANVRAMEKGADEIVAMMKRIVPVRSGALRKSIGWTWGEAPRGSITIGSVRGRKYGTLRITIYAGTRDKKLGNMDAFYARFVEFGTKHAAAHPFFYPSYRALRKRVKNRIVRESRKAIKGLK